MLLYTTEISPRLTHIADFIGQETFGKAFQIVTELSRFIFSNEPKINYSNQRITEDEIWMKPHPLLFEEVITNVETDCFQYKGNIAFFKTQGDYPFDLFAASFYLLSRYEEYLPYQKDSYGRFAYENSIAFRNKFLHLPLINIWLKDFREFLRSKHPSLTFLKTNFVFIPTYDIDEAYSYKYKGIIRTIGGIAKDLLKFNFRQVQKRISVKLEKEVDPFDAFTWMDCTNSTYRLEPRYFFLVPEKLSKYDRNISPRKPVIKKIIQSHAEKYNVGIHPSWQSCDVPALLQQEIKNVRRNRSKTTNKTHYN